MKNAKSFEVWLGVKLTVSLDAPMHENDVTYGAALDRGANWLADAMQEAYIKSTDVKISGPVVDLSDAALRLLSQERQERRLDAGDAIGPTDEPNSSADSSDPETGHDVDK